MEFLRDPSGVRRRIEAKVVRDPGGCWLWQGATTKDGYGTINIDRERVSVHIAVQFAFVENRRTTRERYGRVCDGPRNCVNPAHWKAGEWRRKCAHSAREFWAGQSDDYRRGRTQNKRDTEILLWKRRGMPRPDDPYEAVNHVIPADLHDPARLARR